MIAVEALPMFAKEAKERQKTSIGGANPHLKQNNQLGVKMPQAIREPRASDKAGAAFGVSGKYVVMASPDWYMM
jgi:hypothetical protein